MALQIEEFSATARNGVAVPRYPPAAIQAVAIGGASTQSAEIGSATRFARLLADAECYFKVGANPTAAADNTSSRLPADVPVDIGIEGGNKIAVIAA